MILRTAAAMALAAVLAPGATERDTVRAQMAARPNDPWPRGTGHIVLALPGSPEADRGYLEPGGSFSPEVGSFGVSVWIREGDRIVATSDSIPLDHLEQHLDIADVAATVRTPHYILRWENTAGKWKLDLQNAGPVELVFRSVGPAGGPLTRIAVRDRLLVLNNTWAVQFGSRPERVVVGDETQPSWTVSTSTAPTVESATGWAFARVLLPKGKTTVSFAVAHGPATLPPRLVCGVGVSVPDTKFAASLSAQVAHLLMGIVNEETRPGETVNYPLAWLRDGSYTVVALARAGRLHAAQMLARKFAEDDFFGGFGSEADAPGLALWALEEVASRIDSVEYDRWVWPHVQRKAALILEMMSATHEIRRPYSGPIVPRHAERNDLDLVCGPATDGLINGRMDHHRPLLFVNAVSYRGLRSAASAARRLGYGREADTWEANAAALQKAWIRGFGTRERNNDRTFTSALWPSGVAAPVREELRAALASRDPLRTRPEWTYFAVAEAHQWVLLDEPEQAWRILNWFWSNQASPGFYTWWEGTGEENTFHRWEQLRGWVNPPYVTPHYWTAAEMLLVQLDMLAYRDGDTVVIGAGVPKSWLAAPVSMSLQFAATEVDWSWNGKELKVVQKGKPFRIRPAGAFAGMSFKSVVQPRRTRDESPLSTTPASRTGPPLLKPDREPGTK